MSSSLPIVARVSHETFSVQSRFNVHRIYCIGRNYAEHAREMGYGDREEPFFFQKPTDAVVDTFRKCSLNQNLDETTDEMCHHTMTDSGSLVLHQCIIPVRNDLDYCFAKSYVFHHSTMDFISITQVSSNDVIASSRGRASSCHR